MPPVSSESISIESVRGFHPHGHVLEPDGRYRIDQYDTAPAFASFLPGIAGPEGVPVWCFYVNRAQGVASFGLQGKDNAVAEFLPATWAYQLVGIQGFRTFVKTGSVFCEPFHAGMPNKANGEVQRTLWIERDRFSLREVNPGLGLTFGVEYFTLVNRPFGALVRVLSIANDSDRAVALEVLDGLPVILPADFSDFQMKQLRRLSEAYANVFLVGEGIPYYSPRVKAHDEAEVVPVHAGNFYCAQLAHAGDFDLVEPLVDPDVVFGAGQDLVVPRRFLEEESIRREDQVWENRMPCALVPFEAHLDPGETVRLYVVAGRGPTRALTAKWLEEFRSVDAFDRASAESRSLVEALTQPALTVSNHPVFDEYARQNYLDNLLRGGVPVLLPSKQGPTLLHLYSRRHGDLERDYNAFDLAPHPLSDGPGNFRDVCQNRRSDVWFHPDLRDEEIRFFLSLIQADGYNPLNVAGYRWVWPKEKDPGELVPPSDGKSRAELERILSRPFAPGELLGWADRYEVALDNRQAWLNGLLAQCERTLVASGHHGGHWIDHWTYLVDLLESYGALYPESVSDTLTQRADIGWFHDGSAVVSREERYRARPDGPLQIGSVIDVPVPAVALPAVTPLAKLCALLAIRAVTFDSDCRGIEMEAGRGGWNDALNGLPGMFGSSTCETSEVVRLAEWLLEALPEFPDTEFPVEVAYLVDDVMDDLQRQDYDWERASAIRERYYSRLREPASGKLRVVRGGVLRDLVERIRDRARSALQRAVDPQTGLLTSYYMGHPVEVRGEDSGDGSASQCPSIGRFDMRPLPLFLEGQARYLKILQDQEGARRLYRAVRESDLFDKPLAMYKLNECLDACTERIGRARTFSRGWYENESIWLHMSYKYLLGFLEQGLHEEFFADVRTMLVPFMDPRVYGRSVLENSSFLSSSACPDRAARGRGFVARLSGSAAEFIHIWLLLTVGRRPFRVTGGELVFELAPVLPGDWFTTATRRLRWYGETVEVPANAFACTLLGQTLLIYRNDRRGDTFGENAVQPVRYQFDGDDAVIGSVVEGVLANRLRDREVRRLDVWLE